MADSPLPASPPAPGANWPRACPFQSWAARASSSLAGIRAGGGVTRSSPSRPRVSAQPVAVWGAGRRPGGPGQPSAYRCGGSAG